jgi:hypothetical protein
MANTFTIQQIKSMGNNAIIDWVYGEDEKWVGCSSSTSLSSIPLADRQNTEIVGTYLQEELGSDFFLGKDAELLVQQPPPEIE